MPPDRTFVSLHRFFVKTVKPGRWVVSESSVLVSTSPTISYCAIKSVNSGYCRRLLIPQTFRVSILRSRSGWSPTRPYVLFGVRRRHALLRSWYSESDSLYLCLWDAFGVVFMPTCLSHWCIIGLVSCVFRLIWVVLCQRWWHIRTPVYVEAISHKFNSMTVLSGRPHNRV